MGRRSIPVWVFSPNSEPNNRDDIEDRVFVQLLHAPFLLARLEHYQNYNNVSVQAYRCFLELDNDTFLIAILESRHQPLRGDITTPRVYVRIPHPTETILTGSLRLGRGHLNFERSQIPISF